MDFEAKIHEALLSIPTVAEYLDTTPRTIYNWIKYGAPRMAHRALAARAGTLEHWSGYRFIDGRVIRPDSRIFTRRDLDWFELRHEKVARDPEQQFQNREALPHTPARRVAEVRVKDQPEPLTTSVYFFASINPAQRKR